MSSLEFSAKNVDKAIEKACEKLNLTSDKFRYDILSHGSSGIFGLAGLKKAKIRVHLPEKSEDPDLELEVQAPRRNSPMRQFCHQINRVKMTTLNIYNRLNLKKNL